MGEGDETHDSSCPRGGGHWAPHIPILKALGPLLASATPHRASLSHSRPPMLVAARLLGTVTTLEEALSWGLRGFTDCLWEVASVCPQSPFLGLSASSVESFPPQVWHPSPGSLARRDPGQGVWL